MSEVWFYHLTASSLEAALPQLLQKSLERGWRVLVQGTEPDRIDHLDRYLWTHDEAGFLPHGKSGGDDDHRQPVLLTTGGANANDAQVLVLIDGAEMDADSLSPFQRVLVMFDGNDTDAVASARTYWKTITDSGAEARYWAQESGKWVQKG